MATVTDLESYQQYAEQQQAANNAWSAEQAQKQMDFQKMMSDTAHQREMADLKAAGLNPILAANSGASVPSGAAGETDTSTASNVGAILQQVLSAQSAREVAGMYNAATIAAATIAANASKYAVDTQAETQRSYPTSFYGFLGSLLNGKSAVLNPNSPLVKLLNAFGIDISGLTSGSSGAGAGAAGSGYSGAMNSRQSGYTYEPGSFHSHSGKIDGTPNWNYDFQALRRDLNGMGTWKSLKFVAYLASGRYADARSMVGSRYQWMFAGNNITYLKHLFGIM